MPAREVLASGGVRASAITKLVREPAFDFSLDDRPKWSGGATTNYVEAPAGAVSYSASSLTSGG